MSIYNPTFKLTQHTPIIHFQADQKGATLRASDVKPRIDKYLGGTQKYKLTISAQIANGYPKDKGKNESYFGDHKLCMYEDIILNFNTYFNEDLMKNIEDILPKVFAVENFGSFGNKGYGCFVYKTNQDNFQKILKDEYKIVYYWDASSSSINEVFLEIKYFYALLKSGINVVGKTPSDPTTYYKSLLMLYFKDKKHDPSQSIRWEKRGIKRDFHLSPRNNRTRNIDQTDKVIPFEGEIYNAIKPLLGYSESQEWQSYELKKDKRNPANSNPIKIDLPDGIDRIPSPIFFKVFRTNNSARIFFTLKNEAKFENMVYPNKPFGYSIKGSSTQYLTPSNFSYSNFLSNAVNEINNNLVPKSASGGMAQRVDNFISHLTTNKIRSL